MDCARCGACCLYLVIPRTWLRVPEDAREWVALHLDADPGGHLLPLRCRALRHEGGRPACALQEAKPHPCAAMVPGEGACTRARARVGLAPLPVGGVG